MPVDLAQFTQTFLEESFEGLDLMESSLLELDSGDFDTINAIFRAAHSIKGGAGTFGFTTVADFTHVVETLLDQMRSGQRPVTPEAVDLLLEAVDCTRQMLMASRDNTAIDHDRIAAAKASLDAMLTSDAGTGEADAPPPAHSPEAATIAGWTIHFRPEPHILRTGNEPLRMFQALEELGELTIEADTNQVPALADMDPEACYLAWQLTLHGPVAREAIQEVFEWVEDDCELTLEPIPTAAAATADQPTTAAPAADRAPRSEGKERRSGGSSESSSIRVNIDKIDTLINRVGELVIAQSMLNQISEQDDDINVQQLQELRQALAQMQQHTRDLQEDAMRIRMLPIASVFNRLPRLVHDVSSQLDKQIKLTMSGEQTELDKTVLEKIGDPLTHLVRNAMDHGIEAPEVRRAAGKSEEGNLHINAFHQGGNIVIEVADDGGGIDSDKIQAKARERGVIGEDEQLSPDKARDLLFHPGFSTAAEVTDLSGRGVGLDVVRRNINDLGGHVEVTSELGQGSRFTIQLPLTLAILEGQLARVGEHIYIVPLLSVLESIQAKEEHINRIGGGEMYHWRDEYLPVLRLHRYFGITPRSASLDDGLLMVVEGEGSRTALVVDELLGQQQVVIKSLEQNFRRVPEFSGATILGDGTVALILDIGGLMRKAEVRQRVAA